MAYRDNFITFAVKIKVEALRYMKKRILIVEDDITYGTMMKTWLGRRGFAVELTGRVSDAVHILSGAVHGEGFDLVLSDLRLPDHDGLFLLEWMNRGGVCIPFIMMTSYAEIQNAVTAMKKGARDYISKPCQPDMLLEKINDALASNVAPDRPVAGRPAEKGNGGKSGMNGLENCIEGESDASRQLYRMVELVAPTPMSVLILGASGTGKEYVARRIHGLSRRAAGPFVALDCGAVPKDVAASEFFGHVKGAFTGADSDKTGAFEAAAGGTLFLDEVGNLSYDVQVQLLRALQERRIRPVGAMREVEVDIRLVCATNGNLRRQVADGTFREDLYHRINEFTVNMPPLKERGTDIMLFAGHFLNCANEQLSREVKGFDTMAEEMMMRYPWPGNLREMRNVVRRVVLTAQGTYITAEDLETALQTVSSEPVAGRVAVNRPLRDADEERVRIEKALRETGGNKSKAAQLLGIDRKTIYNKMARYGID